MKKISIKTIYLLAIISIGLISLGVGSTFAMFTATANINNPISITANLTYESDIINLASINVVPGEINIHPIEVCNSTDAQLFFITMWYENDEDIEAVYEQTGGSEAAIFTTGTCRQYNLLIKNKTNSTKKINVGVTGGTGIEVLSPGVTRISTGELDMTLKEKIRYLYDSGTKTTVSNNSSSFSRVTAQSLILVPGHHEIEDSIRYYGSNPNNYILFNCEEYPSTNCETWRIIGLVDGKVKIMRSTPIGQFSWDTSSGNTNSGGGGGGEIMKNDSSAKGQVKFLDNKTNSSNKTIATPIVIVNGGEGINQWGETVCLDDSPYYGADLMKLLNPGYENNYDLNNSGHLFKVNWSTYYSGIDENNLPDRSAMAYVYNARSNDFTFWTYYDSLSGINGPLKNNATRNKIATNTYYLGGIAAVNISSYDMLTNEHGTSIPGSITDLVLRTTTWIGKVALPNASDYGFAANFSNCTGKLSAYGGSSCTGNNWMKSILTNGTKGGWLLNPSSNGQIEVLFVTSAGAVNISLDALSNSSGGASVPNNVLPTLYLNENQKIASGTGTSADPYTLMSDS